MSHREELLNQLKMIQLEWFRSAASLDRHIRIIEQSLEDPEETEFKRRCTICNTRNIRRSEAEISGWDEIFKLEDVVWQQLCKTKEES